MRSFMMASLFCLFLVGLSVAAVSAVLGVALAVEYLEFQDLAAGVSSLRVVSSVGITFLIGTGVCAVAALIWTALDLKRHAERPVFPEPDLKKVMARRRRLRRVPKEDLYVLVEGNGKKSR